MFIKWKEENKPPTREWLEANAHLILPRPRDWKPPIHRLYAYLAESSRVEGKPRQKIITYLASIPAIYTQESSGDEWCSFWYYAVASLCRAGVDHHAFFDALRGMESRVQRPSYRKLMDIIYEESKCHPKWYKNYEATMRTLNRVDYYAQWFDWE